VLRGCDVVELGLLQAGDLGGGEGDGITDVIALDGGAQTADVPAK